MRYQAVSSTNSALSISYGFDCSGAISSIENDAQENMDNFKEDFNSQIQDEILSSIVEPIQDLLPQLRDALNGTD